MKKTYLLLHFAVILGGFTGVFGKIISLNAGLLVWYRLLFSAIILLIISLIIKIKKKNNNHIPFKQKSNIAATGLLLAAHWIFFYASIKYSNISIGVVCFCLASCFTAIFKPFIEKVKFRISEIALSLLTIAGISLIFHFDASYRLGISLGIISSALIALFTIYNEKLVKSYDSITLNTYQMSGGFLGLSIVLPLYLYRFPTDQFFPGYNDTISLLLLALFCTVGLYSIITYVLKVIPAFTVTLSFNLEPLYAIIIAFLFFNEGNKVSTSFYWGLLLVVTSVVLQTIFSIRQRKKKLIPM